MERLKQVEEAHLSPGEALQKSAADIGRDLVEVVADYASWAEIFPTISAVRVKEHRGSTLVLEVDHVEGKVINELTPTSDGELVLGEVKHGYDAVFVNQFDPFRRNPLHRMR